MSIMPVTPSNHLIFCHPLLLMSSIFPSIRVFSNESSLHIMWPNYWSLSFNISPSNEYSVLISFRIDWLDLLAVQGTLKSLLQHHSSKASVNHCVLVSSTISRFFENAKGPLTLLSKRVITAVTFQREVLGWPKSSFGFWKRKKSYGINLDKHFGQPNRT